jgi:hypothetical protein
MPRLMPVGTLYKFARNVVAVVASLGCSAVAQVCAAGPAAGPQHAAPVQGVGVLSETDSETDFAPSVDFDLVPDSITGESDLVRFSGWTAQKHRLTEVEPLRVPSFIADCKTVLGKSIYMQIVVDERGNVVWMMPVKRGNDRFSQHLYDLARSRAVSSKYRPFEDHGQPVFAVFIQAIEILPSEDLPEVHVPFPKIRDWGSLWIRLNRPFYSVEIRGNGAVLYDGNEVGFFLLDGKHRDRISKAAVAAMVEAFKGADFFSLRSEYVVAVKGRLDCGSEGIAISFDSHSKSVRDCNGEKAGMPQSVTELEDTIDRLAGTAKWLRGNSETVPSLAREGWDFKSSQASKLLAHSPIEVLRDLLAAGVAPDRPDDSGHTALYYVAEHDDVEGLRALLSYGADPTVVADDGDTILIAAARAGVSDNVAELLKYHLAVNARNKKRESVMEAAVAGYKSERFRMGPAEEKRADVVRLLAQAGADLNVQDENGNSPLHTVSRRWPSDDNINVLDALIENGAHLNARNQEGDTPLMTASSAEMAQVLVDAGADISVRNRDGFNALDKAKALASGPKFGPEAEHSDAKIAVLEAAARAQN